MLGAFVMSEVAVATLRITDDTTRAEMVEYLAHLNQHAKRQPRVVKRMDWDPPTDWDLAHEYVNAGLDDWDAATS